MNSFSYNLHKGKFFAIFIELLRQQSNVRDTGHSNHKGIKRVMTLIVTNFCHRTIAVNKAFIKMFVQPPCLAGQTGHASIYRLNTRLAPLFPIKELLQADKDRPEIHVLPARHRLCRSTHG